MSQLTRIISTPGSSGNTKVLSTAVRKCQKNIDILLDYLKLRLLVSSILSTVLVSHISQCSNRSGYYCIWCCQYFICLSLCTEYYRLRMSDSLYRGNTWYNCFVSDVPYLVGMCDLSHHVVYIQSVVHSILLSLNITLDYIFQCGGLE